jgi:cytochrome c-type biogenesis protein
MIEKLFTTLTLALNEQFGIALAASFAWGVMSILLSPCHLSSIPLIVGYISKQGGTGAGRAFSLSLLFAIGILASIGLIGLATASLGRMLGDVGVWGNLVVALVFFAVGLYLLDVIRIDWGGMRLRPLEARPWIGALVLGLLFGVGLGPCTFAYMAPVLGVAFSVASTDMTNAIALIAAFGIGHCAVIVAAGTFARIVQRYLNWTEGSRGALSMRRVAGVLVILGGVYFIVTAY